MSGEYGKEWHLNTSLFYHPQNHVLTEALESPERRGKPQSPGRVVAELSFGFWTGLVGKQYEQAFWVPLLHRAFPYAVFDAPGSKRPNGYRRSDIAARLDDVRRLRNRIAHHERILDIDSRDKYQKTVQAISWICPVTAMWAASIECTRCFQDRSPASPVLTVAHPTLWSEP